MMIVAICIYLCVAVMLFLNVGPVFGDRCKNYSKKEWFINVVSCLFWPLSFVVLSISLQLGCIFKKIEESDHVQN